MLAACLLMLARLAGSVGALDVSGEWSLRLLTDTDESAARALVTLKQDGETLTGTCEVDQTEQTLAVSGQAKDNTLTWKCVGKESLEVTFRGTVDSTGRQMSGEWATGGAARGTFKGSRRQK